MVRAVKAAKKSPAYRAWRRHLECVAPADVWIETADGVYVVTFAADQRSFEEDVPPGLQAFLAFIVDVASFSLQRTALLTLSLTDDGWLVSNFGLPAPKRDREEA